MPLTISHNELTAACAFLARTVENRSTIPILSHVLFRGDGTIVATDLDVEASWRLSDCGPHEPFTLPLAELRKVLAGADKGALAHLDPAPADGVCTVTCDGLVSRLDTLPTEDFPILVHPGAPTFTASFDVQDMRTWLAFVAPCISDELTRYYLNGVYIHPDTQGRLAFVATDGHKLGFHPTGTHWAPWADESQEDGVILPVKTVKILLAHIGAKGEGTVAMGVYKSRIIFTLPGGHVIHSKVIDGTYPDYTRVIPRGGHRLTVDPAVIAKSLKRLDGVKQERSNAVKLDASANTLTMRGHTIAAGILSEPRKGVVDVNVRHLLDAVNTMIARAPGHLILELGEFGVPMRLSCAAVPEAFHVIIPMRA